MPKVNYAAAVQDFTPVEPGIYDARLTKCELKEGQKGPYYNAEFTLDESKKKVWAIWSLSDAALWKFKSDVIVLGADPEDLAPGSEVDTDDIVAGIQAAPCRLELSVENYTANDGSEKSRNTVVKVMSPLPF